MSFLELDIGRQSNPVDMIEFVAANNDWTFERSGEDEIAMTVEGKWTDYHVSFSWMEDFEALHLACAFDLKVPEKRRAALYELLALANERLWIGHFGMDAEDGMPVFRHAVLLRGAPGASAESLEDMIDIAITECERFFPAFQFVLWGGKSPADALQAAMLECAGEA